MYGLILVKGNDYKVVYVDDSKDNVIAKGNEVNKSMAKADGILACIKADFSDNNKVVDGKFRVYETWINKY